MEPMISDDHIAIWSALLTFLIFKGIEKTLGLRVAPEVEIEGLDITSHGERGYSL